MYAEKPNEIAPGVQDFFAKLKATHTNIKYHSIMNAVADSKDTMMIIINELYDEYIVKQNQTHLVVEGDAKLYEILQSLKVEYKQDLQWLIPMPGDWHTLMNFQHALMKPYFDAGLKNMAQAVGYPTQQIESCSQFKRTHDFILEGWEATYRDMISVFLKHKYSKIQDTSKLQLEFNKFFQSKDMSARKPGEFLELNEELDKMSAATLKEFTKFIQQMAITDKTWQFWTQFVFNDAMAHNYDFLSSYAERRLVSETT